MSAIDQNEYFEQNIAMWAIFLEKVKFSSLDMAAMNQNNQYEQILSHITYKLSSKFKFLITLGLGTMEFGQVMKFW